MNLLTDSRIYNVEVLKRNILELNEYCLARKINLEDLRFAAENRENSEDWKLEEQVYNTESQEIMHAYYSTSKMYLYDLTLGESRHNYQNIFKILTRFCKDRGVRRVLDFGAGIGGMAIALNSVGIRCDCADIPGETWDYAAHRFKTRNLRISQYARSDLSRLVSTYDMIISLDCLEHLSPLPDYITMFCDLLKPNGVFVCIASFYGLGLHIASNHKYNDLKLFNELMRSRQLVFQGQLVNRCGTSFCVPPFILGALNVSATSGRKLLYKKYNGEA